MKKQSLADDRVFTFEFDGEEVQLHFNNVYSYGHFVAPYVHGWFDTKPQIYGLKEAKKFLKETRKYLDLYEDAINKLEESYLSATQCPVEKFKQENI